MKKHFLLLALLLLCLALPALAEPVSGCKITADSEDTYLDFGTVKVRDIDALVTLLDAMPKLEAVDMYESRLSNEDMDLLSARYPQIEFGWTVRVGDHLVRTDQTAFSTLHTPNRDAEHKSANFYGLKFCKKLEALDIGHNVVTDISFLHELPHLKVLILACNKIKDISVLAELTELEYLELFTNKFTDLTPLSGLTNLLDLNISNNQVTDLTPLYGLQRLERLRICMNNLLTEEQKAEITNALPGCQIGWLSHPTAEGWREHPRYDTIYRIFHSRVYEPFQ